MLQLSEPRTALSPPAEARSASGPRHERPRGPNPLDPSLYDPSPHDLSSGKTPMKTRGIRLAAAPGTLCAAWLGAATGQDQAASAGKTGVAIIAGAVSETMHLRAADDSGLPVRPAPARLPRSRGKRRRGQRHDCPCESPAGLRPFLPADAPRLAEIFRASIAELTTDDYSEAKQAAWAAAADDEAAFAARLAGELTLVATVDGAPVGFAALKGADVLDLLYVHPAVAGQGIGAQLCEAIEKLAAARGAKQLTADASDTALGFFERRGFEPQRRNTVPRNGEWLANTTVRKSFAANANQEAEPTVRGSKP